MKSAPPIAPPGCPELAFSTIDAARIRILSAAFTSILLLIFVLFIQKSRCDNVFKNNKKEIFSLVCV
jgi:hypothetical protein